MPKQIRRLPAVVALLALVMVSAALFVKNSATATTYPKRAYAPMLAADSASGNPGVATSTPTPVVSSCGPRAAVRTLSDSTAGFSRTVAATKALGDVTMMTKPASVGEARIFPDEGQVVRLNVYLSAAKVTGSGLELSIAQFPGDFAVTAGMPPIDCLNSTSEGDRLAMQAARTAYYASCPGTMIKKPTRVVIEGVPHWTATNAGPVISVWPILSFAMAEGWDCTGEPPTVTPTPMIPEIDTLYLSVSSSSGTQNYAPGSVVHLTVRTDPPAAGHLCRPFYSDATHNSLSLPGSGQATTNSEGVAEWYLTLPANAAPGTATFMVTCDSKGGNSINFNVVAN